MRTEYIRLICTEYGVDSSMQPPTAQLRYTRNSMIDYVTHAQLTHVLWIGSCNPRDIFDIASMPTSERYPILTYAEFDVQALCRLASDFPQNAACTCDTNQVPASGSFNWAVFITFEDGVEWVLRSPHAGYGAMSLEITSKLLDSEAATLKYVKKNSDIPVPNVYSYR